MANFANLKAAINAVIKANGQREITGEVMNQVLTAMVNSLGSNYQFAGVATPSTNPGTPDQNVFYMATQAGTYTNFSAIVLQAGISILLWNGSWSSETFFTVDSVPTSGSNNFITSGAVFEKFLLDGGAYDVSAHNNNATFADLSALLNSVNLNTLIPVAVRHGGMSIKFVQTSDNKYAQYRLTSKTFSTFVTDWLRVGVDERKLDKITKSHEAFVSGFDSNTYSYEADSSGIYLTNFLLYVRGGIDLSINNLKDLKTAIGQADYDIAPSGANSIKISNSRKLVIRNLNLVILDYADWDLTDRVLLAVNAGDIRGGELTCASLADKAIPSRKIANEAITTEKVAGGAITTEKIADGAVRPSKISTSLKNSLTSYIVDNPLFYYESGNDGVYITAFYLYVREGIDLSINNLEDLKTAIGQTDYDIAPSGARAIRVGNGHKLVIRNSSLVIVQRGNIDTTDRALLIIGNSDGTIVGGELSSSGLPDKIITSRKLAANSVTTDKLANNSVTTDKLANNSVTTDKVIDENITEEKLNYALKNKVNNLCTAVGTKVVLSYKLSNNEHLIYNNFFIAEKAGTYKFTVSVPGSISSLATDSGSTIFAMSVNGTQAVQSKVIAGNIGSLNGFTFTVELDDDSELKIADRLSGDSINISVESQGNLSSVVDEMKSVIDVDALKEDCDVAKQLDNDDRDYYRNDVFVDTSGNISPSDNNETFYYYINEESGHVNAELYGTTSVSVIAFFNSQTPSPSSLISNVVGSGAAQNYTVQIPANCKLITISNRFTAPHTAVINIALKEKFPVFLNSGVTIIESNKAISTNKTYRLSNHNIAGTLLLCSRARFTGNTAPTISYSVGAYTSWRYQIGNQEGVFQQWRIPPVINSMEITVRLYIPSGTTLYIDSLSVSQEANAARPIAGVVLESHLGLQSYAPENTMPAYEAAALCGYPSCIVTPLQTSDDEVILYHSETQILTNDGGATKVGFTVGEIRSMTYAQILGYDVYKNSTMAQYFNCKVPTLEQFLALCARTGMKPEFSLHDNFSVTIWNKIKSLLYKYGLNEKLIVKSFALNNLEYAYTYLGDCISQVMWDVNSSTLEQIQGYCNSMDNANFANSDIGKDIQLYCPDVTQEKVDYIISRGYSASVWGCWELSGNGYKELMAMGITDFTEDKNCNNGLNW